VKGVKIQQKPLQLIPVYLGDAKLWVGLSHPQGIPERSKGTIILRELVLGGQRVLSRGLSGSIHNKPLAI